jgi:hypothetical protein
VKRQTSNPEADQLDLLVLVRNACLVGSANLMVVLAIDHTVMPQLAPFAGSSLRRGRGQVIGPNTDNRRPAPQGGQSAEQREGLHGCSIIMLGSPRRAHQ